MSQPPDPFAAPDPFAPPNAGVPPTYPAPPTGYPAPPGYPAAPYGYDYASTAPPTGRAPGTDGFAIAALVTAFFCFPLSVVFGIVALSRIKRSHQGGRGLAIAGLVLSALLVVVVALGFVGLARSQANRGSTGAIVSSGKVAATDLRAGDCIQFPAADVTAVRTFDAIPCSQPHDAEAYVEGTLPVAGTWPGEDAVTAAAEKECTDAFKPFIGLDIDSSVLDVTYFYPDKKAWDRGDRGFVCVVRSSVGKTTGTLKGAAR